MTQPKLKEILEWWNSHECNSDIQIEEHKMFGMLNFPYVFKALKEAIEVIEHDAEMERPLAVHWLKKWMGEE